MSKLVKEKIHKIEKLAEDIFRLDISSKEVALLSEPGQFVNIKCGEGLNALLRRPISICDVDKENGIVSIVFQIKGTGTELLSRMKAGEEVDIIAPIGKGFILPEATWKIAVVGGGIGTFPLLNLLKESKCDKRDTYLGFRSKELIVLENEFAAACEELTICTDDGSYGHKGLVLGPLEEKLKSGEKYDLIYTCGPTPMIKGVAKLAEKYGIKCQVSLEERMGCGIGACLVCACKTKEGDSWDYSHVCKDGPVFWSEDVIFE